MTAADRRRLVALSEWTDREWAIFAMGLEAGTERARRAVTEATREAKKTKLAAAALHEHPTSIREALARYLHELKPKKEK